MRFRSALFALCVACTSGARGDNKAGGPPPMPKAKEGTRVAAGSQARVTAVPLPLIAASAQTQAGKPMALEQIPAPWSLTASDGSGLLVTRVDAKAVVQGPLAFTELHLYFANTEDRIREGTFAITLPLNAAVSRFAMENDGQFMEAEVVEKQLARRAYEDFLHRKQDPALMEKAEGNQFTARVFPIAAKAQKHLVISFSQELPGARYTLPLRGLPKVERVDVKLDVMNLDGSRVEQTLSQRNWQPDRDFVSNAAASAEALASGNLVVAQLSAFDQAQVATDVPKALTLLVDTSASRALGFKNYANNLREMIATMAARYGANVPVEVIAFDQDTQAIYSGPANGFGDAHVNALIARGAAGASDLSQALAKLAAPRERVVIVSDGVVTAGTESAELTAKLKALSAKKVERVDVVLAGGIRDEALAMSLVTAGLPRTGAVLDLDQGTADVAAGIGERVMSDVAVEVAGASWVYPRVIKSARPNQRTMVYARMPSPTQTIDVKIGSMKRAVGAVAGTPALVERAAATAEIADLEIKLEAAKAEDRAKLKDMIAKKSVAARVISSQTSLLVLESDGDYARYGIDRQALSDILVVGPMGVEQLRRRSQIAIAANTNTKQPPAQKITGAKKQAMEVAADEKRDDKNKAKEEAPADGDTAFGEDLEARPGAAADVAGRMDDAKPAEPASAEPMPPPPPPPPAAASTSGASAGSGSTVVNRPRPASPPRPIVQAEQSEARIARAESRSERSREAWPPPGAPAPLKGTLAEIDRAIKAGNAPAALAKARAWHDREPGDVLALIGYGEALEASRDFTRAARVYGSIIDLFPGRADLRRFAGERLERIGANARALAVDTYRRAVEERPDHITGHRLLAYALMRAGKHAEAFAAILAGLDRDYPDGRFAGGERVLSDDAGLIGAAYAAAMPGKRAEIAAELAKRSLALPTKPSTRFIMYWETDANDVDFHIQDARGGHAFYGSKQLPSGGELYADITTGYGPECFAIEGTPKAGPYKLSINYYSQGPMGYGMGLLQIVKHDGKGGLAFEDRPYVIMNDHAYVDLGTFK
ncbi:MAG: VIT domain-containing protein [Kofleriaceae bacterium]|nr:VIT domain-containing protein [Kofleriaceae bacterium]